jgi:enoyl-CoA hydratase
MVSNEKSMVQVSVDSATHVAELMLNRPEKLNAFNPTLVTQFREAFHELEQNQDVSCVILRGNGRAFSVGYDLNSSIERRAGLADPETPLDDWRHMLQQDKSTWLAVRESLTPVVAAVHGYALGAAAMLATCSDVVVVSDDVLIGWASVRGGGGWLGPAMSYYLGARKARELELRYGRITGADAFAWGWANYSVPEAEMLAKAREIATDIARTPRELLQIKKQSMNLAQDTSRFAETVGAGAMWDAIAHYSAAGQHTSKMVNELGLRAAIDRAQAGSPVGAVSGDKE